MRAVIWKNSSGPIGRRLACVIIMVSVGACDATLEPSVDRPPIGKADLYGSCLSRQQEGATYCGHRSTGNCWCDDECEWYQDCCGDYEHTCRPPTTTCQLEVSQQQIDFGHVVSSATIQRSIELKNTGDRACGIEIALAGPGFEIAEDSPQELEPGEDFLLPIQYTPTTEIDEGMLELSTHGENKPIQIELIGQRCSTVRELHRNANKDNIQVDDDLVLYVNDAEVFRDWGNGAGYPEVSFDAESGDIVRIDYYDIGWCRRHSEVWISAPQLEPVRVAPGFEGEHCSFQSSAVPFDSVQFTIPLGACVAQ